MRWILKWHCLRLLRRQEQKRVSEYFSTDRRPGKIWVVGFGVSAFILALGFGAFSTHGRQRETRPRPGEAQSARGGVREKKTSRSQTKIQEQHQTAEQAAKGKFVARVAAGQPTANFAGAVAEGQIAHDDTGGANDILRASDDVGI